jgi:biotin transport system substrate-specific component
LAERGFDRSLPKTLVAMVTGNIVIYAFGLGWLSSFPFVSGWLGETGLLTLGMIPFLVGDALKAILAAQLLPSTWKLVGKG